MHTGFPLDTWLIGQAVGVYAVESQIEISVCQRLHFQASTWMKWKFSQWIFKKHSEFSEEKVEWRRNKQNHRPTATDISKRWLFNTQKWCRVHTYASNNVIHGNQYVRPPVCRVCVQCVYIASMRVALTHVYAQRTYTRTHCQQTHGPTSRAETNREKITRKT